MISDPTLRKATAVQQDERSDTRDSQSRSALALSMLDRVGCGYIFLKDRRTIVEANATGRLILGREPRSVHDLDQLTCAFRRLLARAPNRPGTWPTSLDRNLESIRLPFRSQSVHRRRARRHERGHAARS